MFLATIKRRLHRPGQREIPLERLARLWLEDSERPLRNQGSPQQMTRTWTHEDINSFSSRYVESFLPPSDPAHPVIERLLVILDEHGGCPSSNAKSDSEEGHVFAEISLREYSLEVTRIAFDMIKRGHRDYEMIAGKILVITLGHHLGITSDADILGGISAKSVLLLDPLIQDLPCKESVVNAIRTFEANHPKTDEAKILKAASSAARKNEYERAKVFSRAWQQPVMDIKKIKRAIESQPAGASHADRPNREGE
jgi:hypothetical protein